MVQFYWIKKDSWVLIQNVSFFLYSDAFQLQKFVQSLGICLLAQHEQIWNILLQPMELEQKYVVDLHSAHEFQLLNFFWLLIFS